MERFHCAVCDLEEEKCICVKYCCLCMGYHDVRLIADGLFYCRECREACEYKPQDKRC